MSFFFFSLSGTLPFSDDYGSPASEQIKKAKFRFNHASWKTVSQRATELIRKMLVVDPSLRPTIDEVLKDNWLKDKQVLRKAKSLMKTSNDMDVDDNDENFLEPPKKRSRR